MKSAQGGRALVIAGLVTATYYFYQYVMRSAPAVMMPELASGLDPAAAAVAALVGLFYYGYSPFSLVAGVAMDRLGPRRVLPIGAAAMGVGALLLASGNSILAAYQSTFEPLLYGVGIAIVLALLLEETGPAARRLTPALAETRP